VTTTNEPFALPAVAGRLGDDNCTLPLVAVEIDAVVRGLVATTTVRQTFRNTHATGIEATYIFPLPDRAGATAFVADLAGRRIEGELRERGEARTEYDAAIAAGHRAAITEEERSGVFSTRVGNLQPGEDAVITLTLTGPLAVDDGTAEYRFPLVVAPRYVAGQPLPWPPVGSGTAADTDAVPDASRITPPVLLPGLASPVRLALRARLVGLGLTPDAIRPSLHAVVRTTDGDGAVEVALRPGGRLDRDVILRFPVAQAATRTIAAVAPDDEDPTTGTWHVTVVPPRTAHRDTAQGRDVIVVLDRSGSMHGWKIAAARRAAARIVDSLAAQDRFTVLAFDTVVECPPGLDALSAASDRNRWLAVEWLARLEARGGTEMLQPLRAAATALASAPATGTAPGSTPATTAPAVGTAAGSTAGDPGPAASSLADSTAGDPGPGDPARADTGSADAGHAGARERFLVLVTDGQVAAEEQILAALAPVTGRTRIFALGVDQAVNGAFLRRLAALGAGRCELVESEDRLDEVMTGLHRRISPPLVTGLRAESADLDLTADETAPARTPDLFPGAPCSLSGRWRAAVPPAALTLTVRGDGGFAEQVAVATVTADPAVRTCWARARVRDLEDRYAAGPAEPELADQIVAVSLRHRVLSRFTAFVAVDRTRRADLGPPQPVIQPVELPGGWAGTGAAATPLLAVGVRPAGGPLRRLMLAHPGASASASATASFDEADGSRANIRRAAKARGMSGPGCAPQAPGSDAEASESGTGQPAPGTRHGRTDAARPAVPSAVPPPGRRADLVPLEAYVVRANELLARIETGLAAGGEGAWLAVLVDELADDLASVGAPDDLRDAFRRLADALRGSGDPQAAVAAARQVLIRCMPTTVRPGVPDPAIAWPPPSRPARPGTEPESRRRWWR
jgi:Ca-activated chloride channel family protein